MNVERLERLAALLERDAANDKGAKFDLGVWATPSERRLEANFTEKAETIKMDCGTTACALGLAAISGVFKKDGLTFEYYQQQNDTFVLTPTFNGADGFSAGVFLFDIDHDDSRYLFDPDCYGTTPKGAEGELFVAKRIRDFAAGTIDYNYHPGDDESDE